MRKNRAMNAAATVRVRRGQRQQRRRPDRCESRLPREHVVPRAYRGRVRITYNFVHLLVRSLIRGLGATARTVQRETRCYCRVVPAPRVAS